MNSSVLPLAQSVVFSVLLTNYDIIITFLNYKWLQCNSLIEMLDNEHIHITQGYYECNDVQNM